jgi:hypothetical protein
MLSLVREYYADFGPALAAEKLASAKARLCGIMAQTPQAL